MLDAFRLTAFSRDLFRALEIDPASVREAWLAPLLRATQEMTGATVAYLGEEVEGGWVRHAYHEEQMTLLRSPRVGGLSAQVVSEGGDWLEARLRRTSAFDPAHDGWPGVSPVGFAATSLPQTAPRRAWLGLLRTRQGRPFNGDTLVALGLAAGAAATALRNELAWKALDKLSLTDELTEIPNY